MIEPDDSKALHELTKVIHNKYTKKTYLAHLRKYQRWTGKSYDDMINRDQELIQAELERYLEFLQTTQEHSRSYLKLGFSGITLFYSMNNVMINKTRLAKMIHPVSQPNVLQAYNEEDIVRILNAIDQNKLRKHPKFESTRTRLRAMIHFLAASGCRVGAMGGIRFKDISRIEDCYAVRLYAGSKEEYFSFLTPQASKALDDWIDFFKREFNANDDLSEYLLFNMQFETMYLTIYRLIKKADLGYVKGHYRYEKPTHHAFRYRFNTIAKKNKDVNPILAERLLGHLTSIALDAHYLKPTIEELFTEYKKIIKQLTI